MQKKLKKTNKLFINFLLKYFFQIYIYIKKKKIYKKKKK